jgi:RimJ/RimL family protein N-acetyltransferase
MSSIPTRNLTAKSGQRFVIRTAEPCDAAAMLAYIRAVAAETEFFVLEPDEFPATEEQERQWIQEHLDHPCQIVLLAEVSGSVIGNVGFESGPHRRIAHRGNLGISVAKEWRGESVGTALLRTLLEWAKENPIIEKVGLEVSSTNEGAIRLYQKLGFVEAGRNPKEVKLGPGKYVDSVVMYQFVK